MGCHRESVKPDLLGSPFWNIPLMAWHYYPHLRVYLTLQAHLYPRIQHRSSLYAMRKSRPYPYKLNKITLQTKELS